MAEHFNDDLDRHNFKNITHARMQCATNHGNDTLPFFQCLCSSLQDARVIRIKYYYCKEAAKREAEESSERMAEIGKIIGIVLGSIVLLCLIAILFRKLKPRIREKLAHLGMKRQLDACTRMFCICCQKNPKARLDEPPPNQNISGRPGRWGRLFYNDGCLACLEFICDCDLFTPRRRPKAMVPIFGRKKEKKRTESATSDEVELQQPRRMRSVRKAPPPPRQPTAPEMPEAPAFDPEHRPSHERGGTWGKKRAPAPPRPLPDFQSYPQVEVHHPYQQPHSPQYQQPQHSPQHQQPQQPQHSPQPQQSHSPQPQQPWQYQPPQYGELFQQQQAPATGPPQQEESTLNRGGPLRVSKDFQAQLNQTIAGRRWPSESEI